MGDYKIQTLAFAAGSAGEATVPGPTIRFKACAQYRLTFVNNAQKPYKPYIDTSAVTNLHLHGIHVNGDAPADDVTLVLEVGQSYTYTYNMPCDHAGGTFFYHTHIHGITALQVASGAVGALLVDDHPSELASRPASWPDMEEHVLVLLRVDASSVSDPAPAVAAASGDSSDKGSRRGPTSFSALRALFKWLLGEESRPTSKAITAPKKQTEAVADGSSLETDANGALLQGASIPSLCSSLACTWFSSTGTPPASQFYLANGRYKPTFALGAANTWHRLRLVHASQNGVGVQFDIVASSGQGTGACSVFLLGRDGVLLPTLPRPLAPTSATSTPLLFANVATRADVAVSCPCAAEVCTYDIVYRGSTVVASLVVAADEAAPAPPAPLPTWAPCRPYYLRDLQSETVAGTFSVALGGSTVNGISFSAHTPQYTFEPWSTQEWTVLNIDAHPFHLHAQPFQLVANIPVGGPPGWYQIGDWQDTISSAGMSGVDSTALNGAIHNHNHAHAHGGARRMLSFDVGSGFASKIRFRTEYTNKVMVHCHILTHEDAGAMALTLSTGNHGITAYQINPANEFLCPA
ncbi:hypothetical protein HYH03_001200 [Edaphochlamys debaryana]|uniref:Laccase n=1 Tax=Edaphochlamys debaryana TaxID=47281 RepID=A0A836C758_9CHLO|nr:hypothetical protein HYH03_001200 [Edaphochlamys debaryana]|eukprot:KAG2501417.1 hypothetical protein HYH03_001200 [Edaphochlamys debaryana]